MYNWAYDSSLQKWVVTVSDSIIFSGTYSEITKYLKEKGVNVDEEVNKPS